MPSSSKRHSSSERRKDRDRTNPEIEENGVENGEHKRSRSKHREKRHREDDDSSTKHHKGRSDKNSNKDEKKRSSSKENKDHRKHKKDKERSLSKEHKSKHKSDSSSKSHHSSKSSRSEHKDKGTTDEPVPPTKTVSDVRNELKQDTAAMNSISNEQITEQSTAMYDYEDDFEDYSDDFDDDVEPTVADEEENLSGASKVANVSVTSSVEHRPRTMDSTDDAPHTSSSKQKAKSTSVKHQADNDKVHQSKKHKERPSSHINFATASTPMDCKTLDVRQKAGKRASNILRLVEMDTVKFVEFDLKNTSGRRGGSAHQSLASNAAQAHTQTGDDRIDADVQTEELDSDYKWTQMPGCEQGVSGGGHVETTMTYDVNAESVLSVRDAFTMSRFVKSAGQLIIDLLTEEQSASGMQCDAQKKSAISVGHSSFSIGPVAKECTVAALAFSCDQSLTLITAIYVTESSIESINDSSLLFGWNVNDSKTPTFCLTCSERVTSVCFSPLRNTTVFAGLHDGSLASWCLLDSNKCDFSLSIPWRERDIVTVAPSYQTAFVGSLSSTGDNVSCDSPIVMVATSTSIGDQSGTEYTLSALDALGRIHVWTVFECLAATTRLAESDLGLTPGSSVKLVKRGTVSVSGTQHRHIYALCGTARGDSHFVGTDMAKIVHMTRQSTAAGTIKAFRTDIETPADILSVDLSPFDDGVLLSGATDGCIRIHRVSMSHPAFVIHTDKQTQTVTHVRWSKTNASFMYSIHDNQQLHVWDLLKNDKSPINSLVLEPVAKCFDVRASGQQDLLAIGHVNGDTTVHVTPFLSDAEHQHRQMKEMMRKLCL